NLEAFARTQAERLRQAEPLEDIGLNIVLTGPPGVGKTTIARIIGRLFYGCGLLRNDIFFEVGREQLVGKWLGHTEKHTLAILERALGGVLFIDEAYSLAKPDSDRDFGHDVIHVLNRFMENYRDDIVVIVAGYADRMRVFFEMNEGL